MFKRHRDTPVEDCRETRGFTAHDAQLQNSLCGVLTKTRCILPFKPALRDGKGQACFILALLEYTQPFLEWAARPKIAFPASVTCFTSILCGYFQFLLFTLLFILKTMQHTPEMYQENAVHSSTSEQVTGSLMARCRSDNDLQAVTQHTGEHRRPWAACKRERDVFSFETEHKQHTKPSVHRVMGVTELYSFLLS